MHWRCIMPPLFVVFLALWPVFSPCCLQEARLESRLAASGSGCVQILQCPTAGLPIRRAYSHLVPMPLSALTRQTREEFSLDYVSPTLFQQSLASNCRARARRSRMPRIIFPARGKQIRAVSAFH